MTQKELDRLEFAKSTKPDFTPCEVSVGEDCYISIRSSIGQSGFGYARDIDGKLVKIWHKGDVKISEGVEVRDFVTIDRATVEGISTFIGAGVKLDHKVHISHNCKIGKYTTIAANSSIEGSCEIGEYCTIGSNVTVQRKVKVGNNVTIGSGSVVTKDIPDNCVIYGNPAKIMNLK